MKKKSKNWLSLFIRGILLIIIGFYLLSNPYNSTLYLGCLLAIIIFLASVYIFITTLKNHLVLHSKIANLIYGVILLVFSLLMISFKTQTSALLTCLMIAFLCFDGILKLFFEIFYTWNFEKCWITFSGFLSLLLGIILMMSLPEASAYSLGLFAGVSSIGVGISIIFSAYELKSLIDNL